MPDSEFEFLMRRAMKAEAERDALRQWRMDVLKACAKSRRWWSFGWIEELTAVVERGVASSIEN